MSKHWLSFGAVVGLTTMALGVPSNAAQPPEEARVNWCRSQGFENVSNEGAEHAHPDGTPLEGCTHGPDPVASDTGDPVFPADPTTVPPAAPCTGDGTSGKRIEVIYGVPKDKTNSYSTSVSPIRNAVAWADFNLDISDLLTTQHLRWLCNTSGNVVVRNVTVRSMGAASLTSDPRPCSPEPCFTFHDMRYSLRNQVSLGLGNTNYTSTSRIYVTFMDKIAAGYPYCGQGELWGDTSPGSGNLSNGGPTYSLIAPNCWSGSTTLHEIGHNIGAVNNNSPHSSRAGHCYDEWDVMCYNDGGPYFRNGGSIQTLCPASDDDREFDCNKDDYYNPRPPSGSYLANNWNTFNSVYLTRP